MKKVVLALFALLSLAAATQAGEVVLPSKIDHVTVFLSGAQIHRTAEVNLNPGFNEIVLEGVSAKIDPNSLQVSGKGNFIILDVHHNIRYPKPKQTPVVVKEVPQSIKDRIASLTDTLTLIGFDLSDIADRREVLNLEKNMLLKNKLVSGGGKANDSIPLLDEVLVYFRKQLNDINAELAKLKREEHQITGLQRNVEAKLNELKSYDAQVAPPPVAKPSPVQQVIISMQCDTYVTGNIEINYMVSGAGWTPTYDLRANASNDPVELTYKARIHQTTGIDWDEVDLKLSTSNPNSNKVKPVLPVWYMDYFQPVHLQNEVNVSSNSNYRFKIGGGRVSKDAYSDYEEQLEKKIQALSPAQSSANYSSLVETMIDVEYEIKLPYRIKSDGKHHTVAIQKKEIPTDYYHFLVPKADNQAFLMAQLTDWEELQLMPAQANIYFDGSFIGNTRLNPSIFSDTLELPLGTDRNILVSRKKIKDEKRPKLIGNIETRTVSYAIAVKNNRMGEVNLVIEDQIPVSRNEEIEIILTNAGKARHREKAGMLSWRFALGSKAMRKLSYTYEMEYDKTKQLLGQL